MAIWKILIDFEEVKVKTLVVEVQGLGQRATAGLYLGVLKSSVPPIRCLSALQAAWVLIGMFLGRNRRLKKVQRQYKTCTWHSIATFKGFGARLV